MLRRCNIFRTVGIFPLHLDPPNLDHVRVFKQILADPTLGLTRLVVVPLSHQSVTLQKSLHLSAMAGLSLRDFEPAPEEHSDTAPVDFCVGNHSFLVAASNEDSLQQTKDSFRSVAAVDCAITDQGIIVSRQEPSGDAAPNKDIRVEINFQALEMHEDRYGVVDTIVQEELRKARQQKEKRSATTKTSSSPVAPEGKSSSSPSSPPSTSAIGSAAGRGSDYSVCGVTLFQWVSDVEIGGCLADRLWPRIADIASSLPLIILRPTGPAYPPLGDPITESIVDRATGRWHGPVDVLNVRREWSSGYVRRLLSEEGKSSDTLVSGAILRYIDSHNLYRDERRPRRRYVAAVAENAIRLPLVSLDDVHMNSSFTAVNKQQHESQYDSAASDVIFPSDSSRTANAASSKWVSYAGSIPRLELHFDPRNKLACHIYDQLKTFQVRPGEQPDLIVPIGGDGYLMKCVRKFWMRFIPFFGVNAGHVGFLLNDAALLEEFFSSPMRLYQVSMLYCVAEQLREKQHQRQQHHQQDTEKNNEDYRVRAFAFNDAWLERATGQTARFRICVNNVERTSGVRGDGVLVSTAAGSTAYAQALGGSPMPIDTPILQLVGSNCTWPARWRPVHLPEDVLIELESCDTEKRPCRAFVDSVDLGVCKRMTIRASRVAGVQLAFTRSSDVQAKLYKMQFPSS